MARDNGMINEAIIVGIGTAILALPAGMLTAWAAMRRAGAESQVSIAGQSLEWTRTFADRLDKAEARVRDLETRIDDLTSELDTARRERDEARHAMAQLTAENLELRAELTRLRVEVESR